MKKFYRRQYIQFNDLVFDHVDMITADDASVSFKRNETAYTFKHGDYSPHKQRTVLAESYTFSMTLTLSMKKLQCEDRQFYRGFVVSELSKIGRLWAVQGGELIWAWAELDKFGEAEDSKKDEISIDVDVYIPEGIWHKADKQRTFLVPWDPCEFMECRDFKVLQPCVGADENCCECSEEIDAGDCGCCECLEIDMALCYHLDELMGAYTCHGIGYKIVYDCETAERLFSSLTHYMGQKLCTTNGTIAGKIYSESDLDSSYVKIRLTGQVKNPYIEINGNGNQIMGTYEELTIYPDGTVTYDNDCEAKVDSWVIPNGMAYGWNIHPGYNRVIINTGTCCAACAYIELDPITL